MQEVGVGYVFIHTHGPWRCCHEGCSRRGAAAARATCWMGRRVMRRGAEGRRAYADQGTCVRAGVDGVQHPQAACELLTAPARHCHQGATHIYPSPGLR